MPGFSLLLGQFHQLIDFFHHLIYVCLYNTFQPLLCTLHSYTANDPSVAVFIVFCYVLKKDSHTNVMGGLAISCRALSLLAYLSFPLPRPRGTVSEVLALC